MKVRELVKELQALDPNAVIYLSSDPEGNYIRGVGEIEEEEYGKSMFVIFPSDKIVASLF
jgi:hypothetical protein